METAAASPQPRGTELDVVRPATPPLFDDGTAVRLVRTLVCGEADVPMRPEDLPLSEARAEFGCQLGQQRLHRGPDVGPVDGKVVVPVRLRIVGHESVVELDGMLPETRECHGSMVPLRAARAEAALTCLDRNMCDEAHSGRDADFRRARG